MVECEICGKETEDPKEYGGKKTVQRLLCQCGAILLQMPRFMLVSQRAWKKTNENVLRIAN